VASIHPEDLEELGIVPGDRVVLASRRGEITATARADRGMARRSVFMPFCFHEAAANLLTNEALDPYGKIPEFKYCAIRVRPAAPAGTRPERDVATA